MNPRLARLARSAACPLTPSDVAQLWAEITETDCPDVSTVRRWYLTGVRGRRLKSRVVGGRRVIDLADLLEFYRELNAEEVVR